MKVFSIAIIRKDPKPTFILCSEQELSEFGFFQRGSVQEFMQFFSITLSERTMPGVRQSVEQDSNVGHVFATGNGLSGVIITDKEYPSRAAFSILNKILDEFNAKYQSSSWTSIREPLSFPSLKSFLTKYQNPHEADSILKVQKELDETKIILHKTIESVLNRGEKLDNLVAQSEQLSSQSKSFYKVAKKTNSCCLIQ